MAVLLLQSFIANLTPSQIGTRSKDFQSALIPSNDIIAAIFMLMWL